MFTATITSSSSSSCYANGRSCRYQQFTEAQPCYHSLVKINHSRRLNKNLQFMKFSPKYGFAKSISINSSNIQPRASASPNEPSSSSWKKWLLGILLTVILPTLGHKGGLWVGLKGKINKAIETVEHVTEVVEDIAEEAEKIIEEVEEKLPGDSKLKKTLEEFDDLAKKAVKQAKIAEDLVHQVKDVEEEIEKTMIKAGNDQAKS